MTNFHNWTGDEEIAEQVPQFLNDDNAATLEKLDTKFNNSLKITGAADLNSFKDEGLYYCNSNFQAETILNCPTNYAFGLMVWGKEDILYQEVREFNRGSNQDYNNCWRRSYYSEGGQGVWSNWQQMSYVATTLAGYGITDGMSKDVQNSVSTMNIIGRDVNTSYLRLSGGDGIENSACLQLCGNAYSKGAGQFRLLAADSEHSAYLLGSPSGLLTWNNKNIVRSINNVAADENGNVNIVVGGGGSGGGSNITVDAEISSTSTNPVQNKAIYNALLNKVGTEDIFNGFILRSPTASIMWRIGSQTLGSLTASNYTGTSLRATQDSDGNIINTTYAKKSDISGMVKSVNNVKPDENGNVNISVSGGSNVTVDTTLSATSTNPIANKTVYSALGGKLGKTETAYAATKATQDGKGNVISSTYIKSVNNVTPDENGNVNITVSGGGSNITVDDTLSSTSTNAIQNKAVYAALDKKLDKNGTAAYAYRDSSGYIIYETYAKKTDVATSLNEKLGKSDVAIGAQRALQDGDGNTISLTYVKSVNNTTPDSKGNVNITVSGGGGDSGVSLAAQNKWTAQQTFDTALLEREKYATAYDSGTSLTPIQSTAAYTATGNFTLDLTTATYLLSIGQAQIITVYIKSSADYVLTLKNAGTVKYIGAASDLAITSAGLLLNILMMLDNSGNLTSIVQASKLS